MSNKLILKKGAPGTNGCEPDVKKWKPKKNGRVEIENKSGSKQKLWNITEGLLSQVKNNSITIPDKDSWKGTVGTEEGTYLYNYGDDELAPRKGTIDPS